MVQTAWLMCSSYSLSRAEWQHQNQEKAKNPQQQSQLSRRNGEGHFECNATAHTQGKTLQLIFSEKQFFSAMTSKESFTLYGKHIWTELMYDSSRLTALSPEAGLVQGDGLKLSRNKGPWSPNTLVPAPRRLLTFFSPLFHISMLSYGKNWREWPTCDRHEVTLLNTLWHIIEVLAWHQDRPIKISKWDRPEQPRRREKRLKCKTGFAWRKVLGAKRITGKERTA